MAQVRWTPQSADDLDAATDFIAVDSPHFAALFVSDVLDAVERLADFPALGRIVPEINDSCIRELILGNYRIIYRLRGSVAGFSTVLDYSIRAGSKRLQMIVPEAETLSLGR